MRKTLCNIAMIFAAMLSAAHAQDTKATPLPKVFYTLEGCWEGNGSVLGKPVGIFLAIKPILLGTMTAFDVDSRATAKTSDHYQAHLLFGAGDTKQGSRISAFWSDSFGGTFTATGEGFAANDGFDVDYRYPGTSYMNRWRVHGDVVRWVIVAKVSGAQDKAFANYELRRATCSERGRE